MKFFKWLYPGMGVKRWIFLCAFGLAFLVLVALSAVKSLSKESILLASFLTALLIFGIFLIVTGIKNMLRTFVRALIPQQKEDELVNIVYQKKIEKVLERAPHVVVLGGGTGLSVLLHGLKNYTKNISAIVTVTDTGGSSGRLRDELDILPPGDIRNCLVALADSEPLMGDLFQYRFEGGEGLKGHNFGNLFITALSKITGDFERAVKESSRVLAIRGRVIPSTLEKVSLVGVFEDGAVKEGETNITDRLKSNLKNMSLKPENCRASAEAINAIEDADLIIYGPGSLYTSVLPNLLIKDLLAKILESDALKIYVCNAMTQPGETTGYSFFDHVKVLLDHTDPRLINTCIVNIQDIPDELIKKYKEKGSQPVVQDHDRISERGYEVVASELMSLDGQVRHDPEKLAKTIFDKYTENIKQTLSG